MGVGVRVPDRVATLVLRDRGRVRGRVEELTLVGRHTGGVARPRGVLARLVARKERIAAGRAERVAGVLDGVRARCAGSGAVERGLVRLGRVGVRHKRRVPRQIWRCRRATQVDVRDVASLPADRPALKVWLWSSIASDALASVFWNAKDSGLPSTGATSPPPLRSFGSTSRTALRTVSTSAAWPALKA